MEAVSLQPEKQHLPLRAQQVLGWGFSFGSRNPVSSDSPVALTMDLASLLCVSQHCITGHHLVKKICAQDSQRLGSFSSDWLDELSQCWDWARIPWGPGLGCWAGVSRHLRSGGWDQHPAQTFADDELKTIFHYKLMLGPDVHSAPGQPHPGWLLLIASHQEKGEVKRWGETNNGGLARPGMELASIRAEFQQQVLACVAGELSVPWQVKPCSNSEDSSIPWKLL